MFDTDEEPPLFLAHRTDAHAAGSRLRSKNPSKTAAGSFTEAVVLAKDVATGVYGHYDAAAAVFWPEMGAEAVAGARVETLGISADKLSIPSGACVPGTGSEFYDFTVPAGSPPWLFVMGLDGMDAAAGFPELAVDEVTPADLEYGPCSAFCALMDEHEVTTVARIVLNGAWKQRSVEVAHWLAGHGAAVSVALLSGGIAPKIRVQAGILRWVKDAELVACLSKYADSVPGMVHDSGAAAAVPCAKPPVTWAGIVYDTEYGVARAMMSWGALAAWVSKDWLNTQTQSRPVPDLHGVCEPLGSYLRALVGVQQLRNGDASQPPGLEWNCPQKMTTDQCAHAVNLFYWAAVHKDDATRPISQEVARKSLEMYLRFGYVILRKRAYQFHGKDAVSSKRKRGEVHR